MTTCDIRSYFFGAANGINKIITYKPKKMEMDTVTVEPVLKDHPIRHKNVVSQHRWSLVIGSVEI